LTQSDETWYEIYGKEDEVNVVISKFLKSVITTWLTHEMRKAVPAASSKYTWKRS